MCESGLERLYSETGDIGLQAGGGAFLRLTDRRGLAATRRPSSADGLLKNKKTALTGRVRLLD